MPIHGAEELQGEMKLSWGMILFYLGSKLAAMVPFVLGLINRFLFCRTADAHDELSRILAQQALQVWYFPTTPGAIIGLWLVLDVKIFRLTRSWSVAICYLFLTVGAALLFAACHTATERSVNKFSVITIAPVVAYFGMCWWSGARGKEGSFLASLYSIFTRNFPTAIVAFGWGY